MRYSRRGDGVRGETEVVTNLHKNTKVPAKTVSYARECTWMCESVISA